MHVVSTLKRDQNAEKFLDIQAVYYKCDNEQPGSSFKIRGIGFSIQTALNMNKSLKTVISSSGGNAGLAAAIAAKTLGLNIIVFVPENTPPTTRRVLNDHGAEVVIKGFYFYLIFKGCVWDKTHEFAIAYLDSLPDKTGFLVHPFESETTWIGHSSIIHEVYEQMDNTLPDVIVCSVGGGGLLCGILTGLLSFNLPNDKKPIVVCVETSGSDSFAASVKCDKIVTISEITSIAKSLGAKTVSKGTLELRNLYGKHFVRSLVVSDSIAVEAVIYFANQFRQLVEPACGASLGVVTGTTGIQLLRKCVPELCENSRVVVEVCGGCGVSLDLIDEWKLKMTDII
jgi:L-serine/L-threonine ammonia-lyase